MVPSAELADDVREQWTEHRQAVDFSTPYYITFEQLAVRKDQAGISALADLKGRPVGTLKASQAQLQIVKIDSLPPAVTVTPRT